MYNMMPLIRSLTFFQTVTAQVESADLVFLVSLLQQTGANIKIHNCDVTVSRLRGQVNRLFVNCY